MGSNAITRIALIIAVFAIIAAAFFGYFLGNFGSQSSSFVTTQTQTITEVLLNGSTTTLTITKNFSVLNITEAVVEWSGTIGGAGYCEGNLSVPNGCIGSAIDQFSVDKSTTYIFPSSPFNNSYYNSSITTTTMIALLSCSNANTSSTTVSYNETSGMGRIDWEWSQSCSPTLVTTVSG